MKMISQSDIIKTLLNNNCTDEAIMSTALSPNCSPAKLLKDLTETERFDIALDISMKSGLDVLPLWRTWAMRCLKNRNFQGARLKFRHCFPRLRKTGPRVNPGQSKLIADILLELTKLDESKLSFIEEIELIKKGEHFTSQNSKVSVIDKPTIFSECKYYLDEYGNQEDSIRFYIKNYIWEDAVNFINAFSSSANNRKFLTREIIPFTLSKGHFSSFIRHLSNSSDKLKKSQGTLKLIYDYCKENKRYNLLYYVQSTIGDFVNSAATQIRHFYLKHPMKDYRDLNHRVSNLIKAKENYINHLDKLKETGTSKNCTFFGEISVDEVENRIKLIEQQIDITQNFALNEVSGCINGLEVIVNGDCDKNEIEKLDGIPVTLFDNSTRRKTFLAALVLMYFDFSCSVYFSKNGFELAIQLIKDHNLNKLNVFKTAMRVIIEDESCDIIECATLLLDRLKNDCLSNYRRSTTSNMNVASGNLRSKPEKSNHHQTSNSVAKSSSSDMQRQRNIRLVSTEPGKNSLRVNKVIIQQRSTGSATKLSPLEMAKTVCDEVIRDSIGACRDSDYKMELAKLLSEETKFELYIEMGKLSNAQTLAFSMNRPDYVARLVDEAARLNQNHVKTICQLWLAKHETASPIRQ